MWQKTGINIEAKTSDTQKALFPRLIFEGVTPPYRGYFSETSDYNIGYCDNSGRSVKALADKGVLTEVWQKIKRTRYGREYETSVVVGLLPSKDLISYMAQNPRENNRMKRAYAYYAYKGWLIVWAYWWMNEQGVLQTPTEIIREMFEIPEAFEISNHSHMYVTCEVGGVRIRFSETSSEIEIWATGGGYTAYLAPDDIEDLSNALKIMDRIRGDMNTSYNETGMLIMDYLREKGLV